MSMFDVVFPDDGTRNQRLGVLISLIGEPKNLLLNLRLRDGWVEKQDGQPVIAIYTRNGGGNREHFCDDEGSPCTACWGERATEHPAHLSDADDDFDSTYRTYRFRVGEPKVGPDIIATLLDVADDEPRDMSEIWHRAIDALGATH